MDGSIVGTNVDMSRLMWLILGAGSKGVVSGLVNKFVPGNLGIQPDLLAGLAGLIMANQEDWERVSTFGEGMMIAAIGSMAEGPINSIVAQFLPNAAGTTSIQQPSPALAARQQQLLVQGKQAPEGGNGAIDTYSMATYGV